LSRDFKKITRAPQLLIAHSRGWTVFVEARFPVAISQLE